MIPHLYLSTTVDLTPALTWLAAGNERRPVTERLLAVVLFIKAVGRACVEVPEMNGFWTDHGFAAGPGVRVGGAIALRGGGLVAPALHDVNTKGLDVVGREFADLVKRPRQALSEARRWATPPSPSRTSESSAPSRPTPSSTRHRWPSWRSAASVRGRG